jgi:hypothetical protein
MEKITTKELNALKVKKARKKLTMRISRCKKGGKRK